MKLKGLLALGIQRLRELRADFNLYRGTEHSNWAWVILMEYEGIRDLLTDYYGLKDRYYIHKLVENPEVEV